MGMPNGSSGTHDFTGSMNMTDILLLQNLMEMAQITQWN